MHYISVQVNGNTYPLDRYYSDQHDGSMGWIKVAFQMDGNVSQTPYNAWLDQVNLAVEQGGEKGNREPSIHNAELEIWLRDCDDDVTVQLLEESRWRCVCIPRRRTAERDTGLEVRTITAHVSPPERRRDSAFGGEDPQEIFSCHAGPDALHALQRSRNPLGVIARTWFARFLRRRKGCGSAPGSHRRQQPNRITPREADLRKHGNLDVLGSVSLARGSTPPPAFRAERRWMRRGLRIRTPA